MGKKAHSQAVLSTGTLTQLSRNKMSAGEARVFYSVTRRNIADPQGGPHCSADHIFVVPHCSGD